MLGLGLGRLALQETAALTTTVPNQTVPALLASVALPMYIQYNATSATNQKHTDLVSVFIYSVFSFKMRT